MKLLKHIGITAILLFFLAVLPYLVYAEKLNTLASTDVNSGASVVVPASPDGEYTVYIHTKKHEKNIDQWVTFFTEADDMLVIFDDISCMVINGDTLGNEAATRFQAMLSENQMTITKEMGILVVSRLENLDLDVMIISRDAAESFGIKDDIEGLTKIELKGAGQ